MVGHRQAIGDQSLRGLAGAGAALLFCIYSSRRLVGLLSASPVSQFLGRISFLLYLWHFPVLITLTSGLIVRSAGEDGLLAPTSALAIGALTVAVSVALAHWTMAIEGWARSANDLLMRWCWRADEAETIADRVRDGLPRAAPRHAGGRRGDGRPVTAAAD